MRPIGTAEPELDRAVAESTIEANRLQEARKMLHDIRMKLLASRLEAHDVKGDGACQ